MTGTRMSLEGACVAFVAVPCGYEKESSFKDPAMPYTSSVALKVTPGKKFPWSTVRTPFGLV